jgi:pyruvate formate lyase activating enzyme
MMVNYGGCTPLSMSDYPGKSATVLFLRGCQHACAWCHNAAIRTGEDSREMAELIWRIDQARPFVSSLVISGGEPLLQLEAVKYLTRYAHQVGLVVGLQTSGKPRGALVEVMKMEHPPDMVLIGGPNFDPSAT